MPLTHRLRHTCTVALIVVCCLFAANARAQQNDNSAPAKPRSKNIARMSSSDAPGGAKVTITSDGVLNDYSAYRSGDHFYVVIPQANASKIGGVRGHGFEGAQVKRRGPDVVMSFKLQPGASARVDQRFNQLVVQFNAPEVTEQTATKNTNQPTQQPPPDARTQTRTPVELSGTPSPTPANARPTPLVNQQTQTASQLPPGLVPTPLISATQGPQGALPTPSVAPSPSVSPSVAPSAPPEQIAQLQPTQVAPVITTNQPAPSAAAPVSLGATILRNWPWFVIALIVLAGLGLFVFARGSERREQLPPSVTPSTSAATGTTKSATTPATTSATTPSALPNADTATAIAAETTATAVPPVVAVKKSKKAAAAARKREEQKRKEEHKREAETTAAAAPPVEAGTTTQPLVSATGSEVDAGAIAAATSGAVVSGAVIASAEAAPPVVSESDRVAEETRKLLAGESYDETLINAPDATTRQLVAAELMTALATESDSTAVERARVAFINHGYFADVTRDLRSAEAPKQRASAARTLGLVSDRTATPHLIAALEDPAPEVRRAAVEALAELQDPAARSALEALRWRETSRQIPRQLIQRAIEVCTVAAPVETQAAAQTEVQTEAQMVAPPFEAATTEAPVGQEPTPEPASVAETTTEVGAATEPVVTTEHEAAVETAPEAAPVETATEVLPAPESADEAATAPSAADSTAIEVAPSVETVAPSVEAAPAVVTSAPEAQAAEQAAPTASVLVAESLPATESASTTGTAVADDWIDIDVAERKLDSATPTAAPMTVEQIVEGDLLGIEAPAGATASSEATTAPAAVEEVKEIDLLPAETVTTTAAPAAAEELMPVVESVESGEPTVVSEKEIDLSGTAAPQAADAPKAMQLRLESEDAGERAAAVLALTHLNHAEAFRQISTAFDDPTTEVREAAARALYTLADDRADSFTRALREAPVERRRRIGAAIAASGLADEAISNLTGESRDKTYDAFSLLFLMAKAGETAPLIRAIETHPDNEVRLAVVKLLALSGQQEILPSFRRLAVRGSLPTEVRSAVMEAIYQISSQPNATPTA